MSSGEDCASAAAFQCGIEVIAGLHVLANPLQPRNPACPSLVWNTVGGGAAGDPAVRPDGTHATYAEQHFLLEPMIGTAAVRPVVTSRS